MLIEWVDLNHTITRGFGQSVKGLTYEQERPDKIIVTYNELLAGMGKPIDKLIYLQMLLLATKDHKIEITY